MTLTEEERALAEFEAATAGWVERRQEQTWQETMRQCEQCRAWVNRHMPVDDLVRVCPQFNLCQLEGGDARQ